jgi:hypothetical protein
MAVDQSGDDNPAVGACQGVQQALNRFRSRPRIGIEQQDRPISVPLL